MESLPTRPILLRGPVRAVVLGVCLVVTGCASGSGGPRIRNLPPDIGPIPDGLVLDLPNTFFTVYGRSVGEVSQDIRRARPADLNARAVTRWRIRYEYGFEDGSEGCAAQDAVVYVKAEIIRPRWRPSADASQGLLEWWRDTDFYLKIHEEGHRAVAIRGGMEVLEMLQTVSAPSCQELDEKVSSEYRALLAIIRDRQAAYDDYAVR